MLLKGNRKWERSSQWLLVGKYVIFPFLLEGEGKGADKIAGIFGKRCQSYYFQRHIVLLYRYKKRHMHISINVVPQLIRYCGIDIRADTKK